MARRRDSPFVWVTWITKLAAGDAHCEWAAWFRAHHYYDKRRDNFDFAQWNARHAELVRQRAQELRDSGYAVYVEDQNSFKLRGKTGISLSIKPDIVAVRGNDALVVDCKTGEQRNSDYFQVLTYMFALPKVHPACKGLTITGEIRYQTHPVSVSPDALTEEMKNLVGRTIAAAGGEQPTARVPSFGECRFCDIGSGDCPERVDLEPVNGEAEDELF